MLTSTHRTSSVGAQHFQPTGWELQGFDFFPASPGVAPPSPGPPPPLQAVLRGDSTRSSRTASRTCAKGIRAVAALRRQDAEADAELGPESRMKGTRASASRRPRPGAGQTRTGRKMCTISSLGNAGICLPAQSHSAPPPAARSPAAPAVPGSPRSRRSCCSRSRRHRAAQAPARVRAPGGQGCGTDRTTTSQWQGKKGRNRRGSRRNQVRHKLRKGKGLCGSGLPDSQPLACQTLLTRVRGLRPPQLKNPPLYWLWARKRQDLF